MAAGRAFRGIQGDADADLDAIVELVSPWTVISPPLMVSSRALLLAAGPSNDGVAKPKR